MIFFFLEMIEPEKSIKVMERRTCEYVNKSIMAKLSHGTKKKKKKSKPSRVCSFIIFKEKQVAKTFSQNLKV